MEYLSGLFYDQTNPSRQEVVNVRVNEAQILLELDQDKAVAAARQSIFVD